MKRKFCLREYYDGDKGTVLAVQFAGDSITTYEQFVQDYSKSHGSILDDVADRIFTMADKTGIRDIFFKDEGAHCVKRFEDTDNLRIYCLKYGGACIILGQGGIKPSRARTYQQVPVLKSAVHTLELIDKCLVDQDVDFTDLMKYVDMEMEIDV